MALTEKIRKITDRIHLAVTSSRGREVGLFLLFLAISYIFWLLLTLNNESQDDIDVPIAIVNALPLQQLQGDENRLGGVCGTH